MTGRHVLSEEIHRRARHRQSICETRHFAQGAGQIPHRLAYLRVVRWQHAAAELQSFLEQLQGLIIPVESFEGYRKVVHG